MRFRAMVDALPPAVEQRLLNQLTVGCGRVMRAAQLVLADAPCGRILDTLTAGLVPLARVAAQLDGTTVPPTPDGSAPGGERAGLRALRWQDFLATQPPTEAMRLRADLEAMAHQTRELVRAVWDDDDAAHISRHLHATIAALTDLWARIAAAIEP